MIDYNLFKYVCEHCHVALLGMDTVPDIVRSTFYMQIRHT